MKFLFFDGSNKRVKCIINLGNNPNNWEANIMRANTMAAMILAGGRGSRLHDLTKKVAKPAVHFGGKYRIIDFPLSNCANSGISTVGVLTQY